MIPMDVNSSHRVNSENLSLASAVDDDLEATSNPVILSSSSSSTSSPPTSTQLPFENSNSNSNNNNSSSGGDSSSDNTTSSVDNKNNNINNNNDEITHQLESTLLDVKGNNQHQQHHQQPQQGSVNLSSHRSKKDRPLSNSKRKLGDDEAIMEGLSMLDESSSSNNSNLMNSGDSEKTPDSISNLDSLLHLMQLAINPNSSINMNSITPTTPNIKFPRDQCLNFICVFKGCNNPIRSKSFEQYIFHLKVHETLNHEMMEELLFRDQSTNSVDEETTGLSDEQQFDALSFTQSTIKKFTQLYSYYDQQQHPSLESSPSINTNNTNSTSNSLLSSPSPRLFSPSPLLQSSLPIPPSSPMAVDQPASPTNSKKLKSISPSSSISQEEESMGPFDSLAMVIEGISNKINNNNNNNNNRQTWSKTTNTNNQQPRTSSSSIDLTGVTHLTRQQQPPINSYPPFGHMHQHQNQNYQPFQQQQQSPDVTGDNEGYAIPTRYSSRGVQLREQMIKYGLKLFRMDGEGKYICFFQGCNLHMITNFSRHVAKHEKVGDIIKPELYHLSNLYKNQQQPQQSNLLPNPPQSSNNQLKSNTGQVHLNQTQLAQQQFIVKQLQQQIQQQIQQQQHKLHQQQISFSNINSNNNNDQRNRKSNTLSPTTSPSSSQILLTNNNIIDFSNYVSQSSTSTNIYSNVDNQQHSEFRNNNISNTTSSPKSLSLNNTSTASTSPPTSPPSFHQQISPNNSSLPSLVPKSSIQNRNEPPQESPQSTGEIQWVFHKKK